MGIKQSSSGKRVLLLGWAISLVVLLAGCDAADSGAVDSEGTDATTNTGSGSSTNTSTSTNSNQFSGLPDVNSFTLGPETLNPEAMDRFGVVVPISVLLGDNLNSFVEDGTVVHFMAEYGSIGDYCSTTNSGCSVDWKSGQPRADTYDYENVSVGAVGYSECLNSLGVASGLRFLDVPCPYRGNAVSSTDTVAGNFGGLGQVYANRVAIMAWISDGAESFDDKNGDGLFNDGERFDDIGEPFIDHNGDGVYGATNRLGEPAEGASTLGGACYDDASVVCFQYGGEHETYVDLNGNGRFDQEGDGIYNGPLCDIEGAGCTKAGVTIFKQMSFLQAGSWAKVGVTVSGADPFSPGSYLSTLDLQGASRRTFSVYVSDRHNGYMPKGTTISYDTTYGEIVGTGCKLPDQAGYGFTDCPVVIEREDDPGTGTFSVIVKSPDGHVITYNYNISS